MPTLKPKLAITPPRPRVQNDALEAILAGADGGNTMPATPASAPAQAAPTPAAEPSSRTRTAERTKGITLRLTPAQFERMDVVFRNSKFKSKQMMAEELLLNAIEDLAKNLKL